MRLILRTGQRQKPQNAIRVVISINTMETSSVSRPLSIGQRNARVEALLKLPAWPRGMAMATLSVDATSTSLLPPADGAPNTGRQYKRMEPWAYWTGAKVTLLASALLRAPDSKITVRFRCKMLSIIICVPKPHPQATRLSRCWPWKRPWWLGKNFYHARSHIHQPCFWICKDIFLDQGFDFKLLFLGISSVLLVIMVLVVALLISTDRPRYQRAILNGGWSRWPGHQEMFRACIIRLWDVGAQAFLLLWRMNERQSLCAWKAEHVCRARDRRDGKSKQKPMFERNSWTVRKMKRTTRG